MARQAADYGDVSALYRMAKGRERSGDRERTEGLSRDRESTQVGVLDVVIADDRDVLRDARASGGQRVQGAKGDQVA